MSTAERVPLVDRLAALFRSRPGEWLDGRLLAKTAGAYAWRTRVSDLRKRGMTIQNRQRQIKTEDGSAVYKTSEYRYLPASLIEVSEAPAQEATC